ncbi:cytidylyltransferase [Streptococcus pneumoniae]|nr:cytidylyltransferase [Streptococcus pneumoniae]CAG5898465.1 cytidylyltransferase [Streptococcus pneumoniae]CAG5914080.1 cytidylyltransferase [Streptococcus pneumoniae]
MIYAGILAGGTGTRMGISNLPKQFLELGDRPILIHTIEKFVLEPSIEKIVVGVHGDWVSSCRRSCR